MIFLPYAVFDADEIYPGLWQGAFPPGKKFLAKKGFDVLVLAAAEHQDVSFYEDIEIILAPGDDDERPHRAAKFYSMWEQVATTVASYVLNGKKVFVSCIAGHNRSGFITALALRKLTKKSGKECIEQIRKYRGPNALDNMAFVDYLEKLY